MFGVSLMVSGSCNGVSSSIVNALVTTGAPSFLVRGSALFMSLPIVQETPLFVSSERRG